MRSPSRYTKLPDEKTRLRARSDIDIDRRERWSKVQIHNIPVALDCAGVVLQVLAIVHTRIAGNVERNYSVLVLAGDQAEDSDLIHRTMEVNSVVSGLDRDIVHDRVPKFGSVAGEVHRQIAHLEGHDGSVGNVDCAHHVGAVGQKRIVAGFARKDFDVGDIETVKSVQTCRCDQ